MSPTKQTNCSIAVSIYVEMISRLPMVLMRRQNEQMLSLCRNLKRPIAELVLKFLPSYTSFYGRHPLRTGMKNTLRISISEF